MNKIIKFRAWDKEAKEMRLVRAEDLSSSEFKLFYKNEGELMQYTGLKDKNGREVYQGDILKFVDSRKNNFYEGIAEVSASTCGFGFKPVPKLTEEEEMLKGYDSSMFWHDSEDYEVIGNIYGNNTR